MARIIDSLAVHIEWTRLKRLQTWFRAYIIDLPDPRAIEVLVAVNEVLEIFGITDGARRMVFGDRAMAILEEWDAYAGPTCDNGPVSLDTWNPGSHTATPTP